MIVIDRRDDPLFVIRIEGGATLEDLYAYRHLCEDLELRQCSYATVWVDEAEISLCLHTLPEPPLLKSGTQQHPQGPFAMLSRLWDAALSRLRVAAT